MKAKTIEATIPFLSKKQITDEVVQDFFLKVLLQFRCELQLLSDQWYNYEKGIDNNSGTDDVFALIERSYVGVLNNSIVRCFPSDAILQEFSVHFKEKKSYGRADLLIKHWFNGISVNLLFEPKQRAYDGNELSEELEPLITQGKSYFTAKPEFYQSDTYIVALLFIWIRKKEHRESVLKLDKVEDNSRDFYCFYHTDSAGLMVCGNLEKQLPSTDMLKVQSVHTS